MMDVHRGRGGHRALTSRQHTGMMAEQQARQHLQQAGLVFLAANARFKVGEIDLVMGDGPTVVFVEVRSRRSSAWGGAAASVDQRKQHRLRRAAQCWLRQHHGYGTWPPCRFDVVAIEAGVLQWIRQAF